MVPNFMRKVVASLKWIGRAAVVFVLLLLVPAVPAQTLPGQPVPGQDKPAEDATPGAVPPTGDPGAIQPGVIQPGVQPGVIQPGSEGPIAAAPETTTPAEAEYGGPAILSRGGTASLRFPSETVRIRPFLSATGNYDTGITPITVSTTGKIPNDDSFGGEVQAGLYGYYRWKSATLGLDYRGDYRDYIKNSYYNGSNQMLSLIYQKQLERHLSVTLRESAGLFSQNFYTPGPYNLVDSTFANVPTNDLFDSRTIFMDTSLDMTYHMSARLSFNFGGDGFLTRRESSSLYGDTGYRARGDIAYRTSRYATTGAAYDFTNFTYTKGFGGSNIHTLQLTQAFRFGRNWELSLRAGGSKAETSGIIQVAVDPVIAAIIGNTAGGSGDLPGQLGSLGQGVVDAQIPPRSFDVQLRSRCRAGQWFVPYLATGEHFSEPVLFGNP